MSKATERVHMLGKDFGTALCEETASAMSFALTWSQVRCANCRAERRLLTPEEQAALTR